MISKLPRDAVLLSSLARFSPMIILFPRSMYKAVHTPVRVNNAMASIKPAPNPKPLPYKGHSGDNY